MSYIPASELLRLSGKVALVTGAGRGIGQAIAMRLASAGAILAVCDRSEAHCEETVRRVEALGGRVLPLGGDLSVVTDITRIISQAAAAFGRLDILVNNAALRGFLSWDKLSEQDWDRYMAVNSKGAFFTSQAAAKVMVTQGEGGSIINIASTAAVRPVARKVDYNIAKAGIVGMTRSLAAELGPHRIRVNAVGPGATSTQGGAEQQSDKDARKLADEWIARLALPATYADPDDIARAVLFFASPASSYVTGQVLFVDAGYLVR